MATLREMYEQQCDQYCSEDQDWVQFVRDHQLYLRQNSTTVYLDVYRHNTMRYRLEDFLDDQLHYPKQAAWIVLLVNQLGSDMDFRELESLMIPETSVLQWLRERYATLKAQNDNANA